MEHRKAFWASSPFWYLLFFFLTALPFSGKALSNENVTEELLGPVVEKRQRKTITNTEYGEVSAIDIHDGHGPPYHLQFFTLEPNSLFLPVLLHADMVFYVQTGSGKLIWAYEDDTSRIDLRQGDISRLSAGSVFYLESNLETERQKLRIFAIFPSTDDNNYDPSVGAYSRISDLVSGFDKRIMQAAFEVAEELVEAITNKTDTPAIVHAVSKEQTNLWELESWFSDGILGTEADTYFNGKKPRTYNIFDKNPDFKNCYGWSLTVTKKQLKSLKHTDIGFLMVNLTAGSMMGPHWNPRATEIAMVLQGEGMVRVVCGSSNINKSKCENMRFKVKEGDVFVVPRFHPMAQMSFNNESLVFLGFSTITKKNYPQFLAGKRSVFQTIDRRILATSFNVSNTIIKQLLDSQADSIMLGCLSCAEEEERVMIEEARKREEEKRREEEARKREEERRREEEEARKREEERRREEEARKREEEEEARRKEEEEARRREEEEARKREEEEARKREEEEEARRKEEEEARRKEEEEARKREEEEAKKREEKETRKREEEAEARRKEEEEARKREEEEEARRKEEEEARKREEEKAKKREEEETRKREEEEEEARRKEEEEARKREEEEARRREEEEARTREEEQIREEEARREQEEARRQQEKREDEEARRQQEEREKRKEEEQEEARRQQEERERKREEEGGRVEQEKEQARRQQEERERKQEEGGGEVEALRQIKGRSFEGRRVLKIKNV